MHHDQLKGSRKDVFEKLKQLLQHERQPSIMGISQCTGWSVPTVQRSLDDLREWGLIDYWQEKPGQPAHYEIVGEV